MGALYTTYLVWITQHHRAAVVTLSMLFIILAAGMAGLSVTNDMRAYFSADNPQLLAFERLERVFDRQDVISYVLVPTDGDIFDRETLALILELTDSGWQAPYSRRVNSLANYQHTVADGDDLIVGDLIEDAAGLDAERIAFVRQVALSEPDIAGVLVSATGSAASIEVRLTLPAGKLDANDEVMAWVMARLEPIRAQHPTIAIHIGGTVASDVDLGRAVAGDVSELVAFSYLMILIGLVGLLRHLRGTVATLLIITFAISGTMGIYGWLGFTLEAVSGFVPSVVMTIAVADCVHILTSYYHEIGTGKPKLEAVHAAMRVNLQPVFVTSVTTAIGVLMLNFSDSPPYHDLGNLVAIGVMLAWFLSMTLLPALLSWFPTPRVTQTQYLAAQIERLGDWVITNRRVVGVSIGAFALTIIAFIPRNELSEDWANYFDETFEVRRASNALRDHFGLLHSLRYILDSGVPQGINDPAYLADVAAFATWLRAQPEVAHVSTITDLLARLNMNLHGDDPAWRKLPDERGLAAQYLLLYELSLPLGQGLEDTVDIRHAATQLVAMLAPSDSAALIAFDGRAHRWLARHTQSIVPVDATGLDMIFAHMNHRNIHTLLKGVGVGILGIAAVLVVALRSLRLGLLSLLTNLAPTTLAYGTWGVLVGRIDLAASVVMCMSLGIVVDDTVHFLSKYCYARRVHGESVEDALRYAFRTVGLALAVTTCVLVSGFSILAASHFNPTVTTGILMAVTIAYALLIDFFVLPPLLMMLERRPARTGTRVA